LNFASDTGELGRFANRRGFPVKRRPSRETD
jgi:hypothetical protein